MQSEAGLCALGLLFLLHTVLGEVQPGVLVFCDDPVVEKAASSALDKFNEKVLVGHKLALYQILEASKAENDSGSVFSVQFSSRRSDCAAGSSKPWIECNYLPDGRFLCPPSVPPAEPVTPELAQCLGCPEEVEANSEDLRVPLNTSVNKYNSISDSTHLFKLHTIGYTTRQVVAGFRYKLSFDMRKTTCAKAEHKELNDLCELDDKDLEFVNCNSTVDVAPWRHELPEANVECEPGALSTMFTRRRPPGFSPLRNVVDLHQSSSSNIAQPSANTASAKPESSEEEDVTAAPLPDPVPATEAAAVSPFHCPSKPWKEFSPVAPTPADPTGAGPALAPTPSEGDFTDLDLVDALV
uniref:Kininogen 1 n=1 Tax=Myripristis murdjan TaxID=586833 RepID=A0A667XHV6_9TELE